MCSNVRREVWGLTNELVLDLAAGALCKDCAILPSMRVDPLCSCLPAEVACELDLQKQGQEQAFNVHVTACAQRMQPEEKWYVKRRKTSCNCASSQAHLPSPAGIVDGRHSIFILHQHQHIPFDLY